MTTEQDYKNALLKAHRAGDIKAATLFAEKIKALRQEQPQDGFVYKEGLPPQRVEDMPVADDSTVAEKVAGAGETALAIGTGATTGALGQIFGTVKGGFDRLIKFIDQGFTEDAKKEAEKMKKTAEEYGQKFTYEPKTKEGKEYTQAVAETLTPLEGLTPLAVEFGAISKSIPKSAASKIEKLPPSERETFEGIAKMSVKASEGDKKAISQLAEEVKLNPEAVDVADRLGIELPADILSDNTLIKQTTGLVRSQVGEDSAKFADLIDNAVTKADEAFEVIDNTELSSLNSKIVDNFDKNIKSLDKASSDIYKKVTNTIPKNTEVQLINSVDTVANYLDDLGITPDSTGKMDLRGLTKAEKDLYRIVNSPKVTFGALERERRSIGEALGKMPTGKYVNADKSLLKKIYGSLKMDQLDNVENVLGKEARDQLHLADRTFQKKIALEERASNLFGKDGSKSIAPLLRRAITQGSKGDITALNKVFKNIPQDLQKEAVSSALSDIVTSRNGRFNFNDYVKTYANLRKQPEVYNKIIKTIGSDKNQLLKDLYVLSKRISEAKSNIITTGKANQQILKKIQEEALLQRIIKFTVEKGVQKATFGGLQPDLNGLFKSGKDKVKAVSELFASPEFKELAIEAIDKEPTTQKIKKLTNSKVFKDWVKASGQNINNPEAWILESFKQQQGEEDNANN